MLSDIIDTYGENLVVAVMGVGIAFVALFLVLWLIRRRGGPAPFLKGGRNRQPRLQVLDATAVDARRRLVLVRRDNVEHLIMIGGPTDIVVESGIGAIPIVTDITNRDQGLLADHNSSKPYEPAPVSVQTPIAAPAPAFAATPKAPKPSVVSETPVAAPSATAAPKTPVAAPAAPAPRPAAPLAQQSSREAVAPVPVEPKLAASNQPLEPAPAVMVDAPKQSPAQQPNSPLMTSAMRPRAAAGIAAHIEPTAPSVPPQASSLSEKPSTTTFTATPAEPVSVTASLAPVVDRSVDDIFDAARERVLPDLNASEKSQLSTQSSDDSFSAELRDDFESFLNAEIEKNNAPSVGGSTEPKFGTANQAVITGATVDSDAQKEMARIFGEMAVKRD